jgi:hypothetical protein
MIIVVILVAIILIIWLQYPQVKKTDENKQLYLKIFDTVKIPILVICFIIIIYHMSGIDISTYKDDFTKKLDVYMSAPKF